MHKYCLWIQNSFTSTKPGAFIPLAQANVLVRDTWTLDSKITNNYGYCKFKRLRAKAKYVIQWDRHEFNIRDNTGMFQAEDKGPKLHKQQWNHNIKGGREQYRGHIFQAAHHFYYGNTGGLTRPPTNSILKTQMKIAAIENRGVSSHKPIARWLGIAPRIQIKRWGLNSEQVYGTTIHELDHAAHWRVDQGSYSNTVFNTYIANSITPVIGNQEDNARRFLESWATGVEIYLTNLYYKGLGNSNYEYNAGLPSGKLRVLNGVSKGNDQTKLTVGSKNKNNIYYTTAVYDMTDTFNQRTDFGEILLNRSIDNVWESLEN